MKKYLIALFALVIGFAPLANAYRDRETGTFLTRDPIGYADGPNVYCYVHCNPITHFDAFGLDAASPYSMYRANTETDYAPFSGTKTWIGEFVSIVMQDPAERRGFEAGVAYFILFPLKLAQLPLPGEMNDNPSNNPTVDNQGDAGSGNQEGGAAGSQGAESTQQATNLNQRNSEQTTGQSVGGNSAAETQQESSETATRYMGEGEANEARRTGNIPNYDRKGNPRPTHLTTDPPVNSGSEAGKKYELPETPTHRATVPKSRVPSYEPTPDGRPTTSGGGLQTATSDLIPVTPDEIIPLEN